MGLVYLIRIFWGGRQIFCYSFFLGRGLAKGIPDFFENRLESAKHSFSWYNEAIDFRLLQWEKEAKPKLLFVRFWFVSSLICMFNSSSTSLRIYLFIYISTCCIFFCCDLFVLGFIYFLIVISGLFSSELL